jgi:mannose-1-phosphate guanylyltransferase
MRIHNNYVAIMAGGIGSRFWPISKTKKPKQFLDLLGTGRTLIQQTYDRFKHFIPKENIFIITNKEYIDFVHEQLPEVDDKNILREPFRKNTAPTATFATYKIKALNPDANILFTPSDHLITNEREYERNIYEAFNFVAQNDALMTFGVKPNRPEVNFGYIQYETGDAVEDNIFKVKTFTEKPNLDLARTFLQSGDFLWNSGILAWNVNTYINALEKVLPDLYDVFVQIEAIIGEPNEDKITEKLYMQCTNVSIDYGILERIKNVYVLPVYFGWTDLGSWDAIYNNVEKDYLGNAVIGSKEVLIIDANNCLVQIPQGKTAILQGLENFIVIDNEDSLLICHKSNRHQIKNYLSELKRNFGDKYL